MRQSWDQGSLLKLIDVIGKTGRNWPIHAGKDQIHLISASVKSSGIPIDNSTAEDSYTRSRGNSQNVTRDPHASLELFAPRAQTVADPLPPVAARRASAKPPPRDYRDLFAGNDSDQSPAPPVKAVVEQSPSPAKPAIVAAKAGAGKNYAPSRLFETDESEQAPPPAEKDHSTEHLYRPNPAKYQHFEFADGSDPQDAPKPAPPVDEVKRSKHGSQWNFDDFATPHKPIPSKILRNDEVHWGNEEEEVVDSPIKQKHVLKPRKDTQTHIEFQDDGTPRNRVATRTRGASHNTGLGLYKNNVIEEDERGNAGGEDFKRLDTISNVKDRSKDFDPHFSMSDESPAAKPASEHVPEDRAKVIKMMGASWTSYDESPSQKENLPGTTSKSNAGASKDPLGESTNTVSQRNDNLKGITGGDGMGGIKGAGRQWGIGDDSEEEVTPDVSRPSKYKGRNRPTGGDFWDL